MCVYLLQAELKWPPDLCNKQYHLKDMLFLRIIVYNVRNLQMYDNFHFFSIVFNPILTR